jgi:hypothetical protein
LEDGPIFFVVAICFEFDAEEVENVVEFFEKG